MAIYEKLVDDTTVAPLADHVGLYGDEADEKPYYIKPDGTKHSLVGPAGPAGADGVDGADGADGADGSQILTGAGAPGGGTGVDGDFYINTTNGDYYKKVAGAWGAALGNLTGPAGAAGAAGTIVTFGTAAPAGGSDGDVYIKTDDEEFYKKEAGVWNLKYTVVGSGVGGGGVDLYTRHFASRLW